MNSADAVIVAANSATYNIVLQVLLRVLSFISNAALLRLVTKDVLGIMNVRLMLLYSTTHCLSREAVRRSCPSMVEQYKKKSVLNLLWLPVPVFVIAGLIIRIFWLYVLEVPNNDFSKYNVTVNCVLISVFIETMAEPLYLIGQNFNFVRLKVIIEGISHCFKFFFLVLLTWKSPDSVMYNFCCCQILSSIIYTFAYYFYFIVRLDSIRKTEANFPLRTMFDLFPAWTSGKFIDESLLILTKKFYKQTLFKQLLTEGERYIMTFFELLSFKEQGVFDAVSNLGSIAARLLFFPIEDSSYLLFSRLLKRGGHDDKQNPAECKKVLQLLTKLMILIGLIISIFGHSYSSLLLLIYGGKKFADDLAVFLLRWQCKSILFIAINGITECFLTATMTSQEIDQYSKKMFLFSGVFLFLSYWLVRWYGSVGFVLANCLNMICRITNSCIYIHHFFMWKTLHMIRALLPHRYVLMVFSMCFILTSISEVYLFTPNNYFQLLLHLTCGVCCFILLMGTIYRFEKDLVHFIIYVFFKRGTM